MKTVYVHPSVKSEKLRELLEEWGALSSSDEQADFVAHKDSVEIDEQRDTILVVEDEADGDRLFFDLGSENKVQALLYVSSLENSFYQRSFRSFLDDQAISFEDIFSEIETKNFKVSDHLSIGYYTDIVAAEALNGEFNILRLRKYLFDLFTFLGYLNKGDVAYLPFEVEFCVDGENLFIKVHTHVQNFVREYLWGTIERRNDQIHFHELLTGLANESDLLDIHYLQSTSKLVFSALWNKDLACSSALFLHSIQSYNEREDLKLRPKVQLEKSTVNHSTENLPDDPVRILGGGEENSQKIIRVKRIVEFTEDQIEDPTKFDREELERILGEYPDATVPPELSDEEKDYIVECVREEAERARLNESYERVSSNVEDDDFAEKVKSSIAEADFDEVESILISGEKEDLGEETQRIQGEREDLTEDSQVVSGEKEDLSEEKITISGEREDLTPEKWELKSNELQDFLDEKIQHFKENPDYSRDDLEKDFKEKAKEDLNIGEKEAQGLASYFMDKALSETSEEILHEKGEVSGEGGDHKKEALELRRDVDRLNNENQDLRDKNGRLLKILETTKEKVRLMQEIEDTIDEDDEDEAESFEQAQEKLEQLKQQNQYLQKSVKSTHGTLKRLKESHSRINQSNQEQIERLKEEKEQLQEELRQNDNSEEREELRNLRKDYENLQSQLEMANERASSLNEKLEKQKKDMEEKHRKEVNDLYSKISAGTERLQEFKKDKEESERKLKEKEDEIKVFQNEFEKLKESMQETPEQQKEDQKQQEDNEKVIKDLEQELRSKNEELKETNRKVKQYEQKVRFLNAQVENQNGNSQKGGAQGGSGDVQAPNQKQLEHQIKQLTQNNERLEQTLEKTNEDLAEKKKELHKLNQELNATKAKLAEYERKESKKAS